MKFEDFFMEDFNEVEEIEREILIGGKIKKMKFKPMGADKGDDLRKKCRKITYDKKHRKSYETDADRYTSNLIIETTTYPDLKNSELQSAWGVMGAEELLAKMKSRMTDGEYAEWATIVNEVNGYDNDIEALKEEAKN